MTERDIFIAALQIEDPAQRQSYLDEACAKQPELRKQVENLLHLFDSAGSFLEKPAAESAGTKAFPDTAEPALMHGTPADVMGPYKLIEQIGEGGMGTVWIAQQSKPVKRLVAVKLIKAGMDSKQVIARFEAERQALALMDHPNIARVLDAGTTSSGRPYFVMDLVKGVPITTYCDEHHLTPRQRLELFIPVCHAIQHAHQKGIIHRDLKPSNVLVGLYDGKPVPRIIDFGVAKAAGQTLTDKTLFTGFGTIVGTIEYMSPEQAERNQPDIDTRSDIYSLGVLLYELLTGSPPFDRKQLERVGTLEMLRVIREQEPSKPSTKLSTADTLPTLAANRSTEPAKLTRLLRGELDWIVMKALEKDRSRRYETANGFAMDVQRYLEDEPVLACSPTAGYRLRKYARKYKKVLATVAAFVALLLVATAVSIGLAFWALDERNHAEDQKQSAEANFKRALEAVDQMLTRVSEVQLLHVPHMEPVRRDLLQDALRFYQEFLRERGESPTVRTEAAHAYKRVGQIQVMLGHHDEGEVAYGQAESLLQRLLDESPGDPSLLNELGEIHNVLGLLYHSTERRQQAEATLERGVTLLEQVGFLAKMPLKNQQTLAEIHNSLQLVYRQAGDLDKAETAFFECKRLAEHLLANDPNDVKALNLLARCHQNVALVYGAKERIPDAEAAHQKAADLFQALSREDPDEVSYRKGLASTLNNLGLLYTQTRQHDKAEKYYQQSLDLHKAIFDDHPKVLRFRVDLAGSYSNMASHIRRTRSPEESLEWTAQAISIVEPVLESDPRYVEARMFLFDAFMGRGYALVSLGCPEDAAKDWRKMIEISDGQTHFKMRIYRPFALVFLGEHAQATSEIETLIAEWQVQGRNLLLFAKVYSLCSAAADADARLPNASRQQLADEYGGRSVELLRQAQAAGFFQDPGQLPQLKETKDLDAIRARPDFQLLLADLEKNEKSEP